MWRGGRGRGGRGGGEEGEGRKRGGEEEGRGRRGGWGEWRKGRGGRGGEEVMGSEKSVVEHACPGHMCQPSPDPLSRTGKKGGRE